MPQVLYSTCHMAGSVCIPYRACSSDYSSLHACVYVQKLYKVPPWLHTVLSPKITGDNARAEVHFHGPVSKKSIMQYEEGVQVGMLVKDAFEVRHFHIHT